MTTEVTEDDLHSVGELLSAAGYLLMRVGETPTGRLIGIAVTAAGDLLTSSSSAILAANEGKPLDEIVGLVCAEVVGSYVGVQLGTAVAVAISSAFLVPIFDVVVVTNPPLALAVIALHVAFVLGSAYFGGSVGGALAASWWERLFGDDSPLSNLIRDPLVLDLDGDGVELSHLEGSGVYFDYDNDGFAERTGWVSADDGLLAFDANGNGTVDGISELFGSPTQDGFAVLETFDTNGDGKIDASDSIFEQLRVWRDLDQDGVSDAGELLTLTEAGIASISLTRTEVTGTNAGHEIGYQALYTRTDGSTAAAQTVYFQTDRQDTIGDNTPGFTAAEGVDKLPQLPGSGQINSVAWKATQDAAFKADWTALTDSAAELSPDQLRAAFENLVLRWASVDTVVAGSRGQYVDAQHLAFVEKFFGVEYKEIYAGNQIATFPTTQPFGAGVEASFDQIVDAMLTAFLAQSVGSGIARGADITEALESPYFFYALLDFRSEWPEGVTPPETSGNVGMVLDLIKGMMPEGLGAAASYLARAISGLDGVVSIAFQNDRAAYVNTANAVLSTIEDSHLRLLATEIVKGTAALGSEGADGIARAGGDSLFIGGKGDDFLVSGAGSDLFVYSRGDGTDYIRDSSASLVENDTLFLADIAANEVTYERVGNNLVVRISGTTEKIIAEQFFADWGTKNRSIDQIRFSDGTTVDREGIRSQTITAGNEQSNLIQDSALNDVLRGGQGHDEIRISGGNDTIHYAAGDGFDLINDTSGVKAEVDTLSLAGLGPSDIQLSRSGDALLIKVLSTGEIITDSRFFAYSTNPNATDGWNNRGWGIDAIRFDDGTVWDRQAIRKEAWIRGNDGTNGLVGSGLDDTFQGGKGNDVFEGQGGADTYHWKKGDGSDTITDNANSLSDKDRLVLADVYASDVTFSYAGNDLLVTVKSTEEVIHIKDVFLNSDNMVDDWNSFGYGIDEIKFAGGTTYDRQEIFEKTGLDFMGKDFDTHSLYIDDVLQWAYFVDEFGGGGIIAGHPPLFPGNNDILTGTDADNTIGVFGSSANFGHNSISGLRGNDSLTGGHGSDSINGGEGDDYLFGDSPYDTLTGEVIDPEPRGNDILDGDDGDDVLYGGRGNDTLLGGDGADQLFGNSGSDYLQDSSVEDDRFDGGSGDDVIVSASVRGLGNTGGANGDDTFIYRRGDGNDIIFDGSHSLLETDRLILQGIDSDEVELSFSGDNLVIRILDTSETVVDEGFFWSWSTVGQGIDRIEFADGVVWDRAAIRSRAEATPIRGTDARDYLHDNGSWSQKFEGGLGDDIIVSASVRGGGNQGNNNGNDIFLYSRGDGNDLIFDGSHSTSEVDRLVLSGIEAEDLELSRNGLDLLVRDTVTGQTIVSEGFYWNHDGAHQGFDVIEFSDGTVWDRNTLFGLGWYRGSVTNDTIQTYETISDTFYGGLGNDLLISARTRGGGNNGANTGNDTFVYNAGDGNDIIFDGSHSLSETDTLVLGGLNPDDVSLSLSGLNLLITINATGHVVTDEGAFWNRATEGQGLDRFEFADGTVWNRNEIRYWAQEGSAFYAGSSASETLIGSYLDQSLSGGNGNDFIDGKGGVDTLFGDAGNDTLALSVADIGDVDALDGGAGTDTVSFAGLGSAVHVDLVVNQGEAKTSDQPVLGTSTLRLVATLRGLENVTGTAAADEIYGDAANNILIGGGGNDTLDGRSGDDTLKGGAGNDTLVGYLGNDAFEYTRGDGDDIILETAASGGTADKIGFYNVDPAKLAFVRLNGNLVVQIAESAVGAGDGGSITLVGPQTGSLHYDEYGIEIIEFGGGAAWDKDSLRQRSIADTATDGNDVLVGTNGWGTWNGRKGNDSISGGGGDDTYVYARGDGNDTLNEARNGGYADQLQFTDINASDVTLVRNGTDVTVMIAESAPGAGDGGSVLLKTTLDDDNGIGVDRIVFADGIIWTRADVRTKLFDQVETSGNDTITGFNAPDTFEGGLGDDVLVGLAGNDTYIYNRGDGNDTVNEVAGGSGGGSSDKLELRGISTTSITIEKSGLDLVMVVAESAAGAGDGGRLLLYGTGNNNQQFGIEAVEFDDGTVWTANDLRARYLQNSSTNGDDNVTGFNTADTFEAGLGNDTMIGSTGNDTFIYNRGDGNDTVDEVAGGGSGGSADKLILRGISTASVRIEKSGLDLVLVIAESTPGAGDGGRLFLYGTGNDYQQFGIERVEFDSGAIWTANDLRLLYLQHSRTSGDDTINGSNTADSLAGGAGNDVIEGREGNDTFTYARGDGHDIYSDASGTADRLVFSGISSANVTVTSNGPDITILVAESSPGAGDGGSVVFRGQRAGGAEQIQFSDVTWTRAQLVAAVSYFAGTGADETITGTAAADDIRAGLGNDLLAGQGGNDSYKYNNGDGNDVVDDLATGTDIDSLVLSDLNLADIRLERPFADLTDLVIRNVATGETITVNNQFDQEGGVEKIFFADGSSLGGNNWSLDGVLIGMAAIAGTQNADVITGSGSAEIILGNGGNDTINGGAGVDQLDGGDGDDIFVISSAPDSVNEIISGGSGADKIRFASTTAGQTLVLSNNVTGLELVAIENGAGSAAGTTALNINAAAVGSGLGLVGNAGTNSLTGTAFDDTLDGLGGNDTFVFNPGFGNDTINDFVAGAASADVIEFSDDVFADFAAVLSAASQVGSDTLITWDADNTVLLKNVAMANLHQDDFRFIA